MFRRWTIVGVSLALMLCTPAAAATRRDATSTHAFVIAAVRFLHTTIAHRYQEVAAVDALISHVDSGCKDAIPATLQSGTPAQQRTVGAFDRAVEGELALAEIRPLRSAYQSFSQAIVHLQWSNRDLNRRIAITLRQGRATAALRAPNICQQASLARASNFSQTPPAIRTFVRRFTAATSAPSSSADELAKLMKPLANPGDLAVIKQVHQLQRRVEAIVLHLTLRALPALTSALFG